MSMKFIAPQGAYRGTSNWSHEIVNLERVETISLFTRKARGKDRGEYGIVFFFGRITESGRINAKWFYPSKEERDADFERVLNLVDSTAFTRVELD